jgi:hypothetical protein
MNTIAKFKCTEVNKRVGWGENPFVYDAKLSPVIGDSEENKKFYAASPGGQIVLTTIKDGHFEVGNEYYVKFEAAN